jgi:hypothetical protein
MKKCGSAAKDISFLTSRALATLDFHRTIARGWRMRQKMGSRSFMVATSLPLTAAASQMAPPRLYVAILRRGLLGLAAGMLAGCASDPAPHYYHPQAAAGGYYPAQPVTPDYPPQAGARGFYPPQPVPPGYPPQSVPPDYASPPGPPDYPPHADTRGYYPPQPFPPDYPAQAGGPGYYPSPSPPADYPPQPAAPTYSLPPPRPTRR